MDILIKNVDLIPMDGKEEVLEKVNIYIKEGIIEKISGEDLNIKADKIIEGEKMLAMPGLINAHTHLGMSILRNYADDLPLHDWLEDEIWPVEAKFTEEDIYWGSLLSMVEMIESGTTTFADMYFFMDQVGKATKEVGMRGVLSRGVTDDYDDVKNAEKIEDMRNLYNNWHDQADGRIRVMVGAHAPYTCGSKFLKECIDLAKELDTALHIHLSETKKELDDSLNDKGMSPIKYAESIGMFDIPVLAAHCVHLDDEDIDVLSKNAVYPVNNPGSNLKLASGFARVDEMLKKGIPVSLGTDGSSSNNNLNMFEEINLAAIVNKAVDSDATSVSAYKALEMGTINGAKGIGMEDRIGSIEIGKEADIILIDMDKTHLYPQNNPISSLAYSVQGSDVDTSIINGQVVMENRKINTVDIEEIKKEIIRIQEELKTR